MGEKRERKERRRRGERDGGEDSQKAPDVLHMGEVQLSEVLRSQQIDVARNMALRERREKREQKRESRRERAEKTGEKRDGCDERWAGGDEAIWL